MKTIKLTDTYNLIVLEKGDAFYNEIDKIKSPFMMRGKFYFTASEISEEQAREIVPDWKTIRPYGALDILLGMISEALKEYGIQIRKWGNGQKAGDIPLSNIIIVEK